MAGTSALPRPGPSVVSASKYRADAVTVLALLALSLVALWPLVAGGTTIGLDSSVFFLPMYSFLGEQLSAGNVPGWNPYQLSGAPFAADPQSGWMYWPAMLLFSLLPLDPAAKAYIVLHLVGAGLGVYALARVLGIAPLGALVAAVSYELSGYLFERNVCCFAYTGVAAWLPLALISMELSLRSRAGLHRVLWLGAGGLAVSQLLAAWLGQGSYYALLALGGYTAYRTLLSPPDPDANARARLQSLLLHGGGILVWGFALAAAGLLPRLEYNAYSSLASGYEGTQAAIHSGWAVAKWRLTLVRGTFYMGGATLALALAAPALARTRHAAPYWFILSVGALVLSGQGPTPLHALLYRLPGFARLHPHDPERVMVVFYLGTALLAGAAVSRLLAAPGEAARLALVPMAALAALWALTRSPAAPAVPSMSVLALGAALAYIALCPLLGIQRRGAVTALLLLASFGDMYLAGRSVVESGPGGFRKVNLEHYYEPGSAGRFLLERSRRPREYRYFGYDYALRQRGDPANDPRIRDAWLELLYRYQFANPIAGELLVNNRATLLGTYDIQGYNPIQPARYVELFSAINGHPQEYRSSYLFQEGLDSPLLDLLNARYAVVPANAPASRLDIHELYDRLPSVDEGSAVRVLERPRVLPPAWLVHEARRVERGEALQLLADRTIDPRRVALLEEPPPTLAAPTDAGSERVETLAYEPDRIRLLARTGAPALLVLSEMYYPAWKAYVDGKPAKLYATDHVLRGVALPAGEHGVELRYESWTLSLGLAISGLAYALLLVLTGRSARDWKRAGTPGW